MREGLDYGVLRTECHTYQYRLVTILVSAAADEYYGSHGLVPSN